MRTKHRIAEGERLLAISLKRCGRCFSVKHLDDFHRGKGLGDRRSMCKPCHKAGADAWRMANPEKVRSAERARLMDPVAAEGRAASARRYLEKNRELIRLRQEATRRANGIKPRPVGCSTPVEVLRKRCREYKARNRDKVREYRRRAISTPAGKIRNRVRVRVRECLRTGWQGGKTFAALGYTIEELRAHLERQFVQGMGWHNMDEWHIDHIIPLSSFHIDSLDSPDFRRAWCLSNLRPLWAAENISKQDKILTLL